MEPLLRDPARASVVHRVHRGGGRLLEKASEQILKVVDGAGREGG